MDNKAPRTPASPQAQHVGRNAGPRIDAGPNASPAAAPPVASPAAPQAANPAAWQAASPAVPQAANPAAWQAASPAAPQAASAAVPPAVSAVAPQAASSVAPQADSSSGSKFDIRDQTAQVVYQGGSITINNNQWRAAERALEAQYKRTPWIEAETLAKKLRVDAELVLRAALKLKSRRLLLLCGEPELGKATLALEVTRRAASDLSQLREVLMLDDVTAAFEVPIEAWTHDPRYRDRVVVLKDAFAHGNTSLLALGPTLSRERLAQLKDALCAANLFVVLTSDELPPAWRSTADELCCTFSAPHADLLRRHLDDEIAEFANESRYGATKKLELDDGQRTHLVEELRTIPRIVRFRRQYFTAIASGNTTIAAALRDFDHLNRWFMTDLRDRNPPAWCLVFATCLLQADPEVKRVPWAAVMSLATLLARQLRHCVPSWRNRQPQFVDPIEALLEAAELDIATSDLGDVVSFRKDRYRVELWKVLAGSGRALLSTIYPILDAYTRRGGAFWGDAMTALGRIGAIDGIARLHQPLARLAGAEGVAARIGYIALGRFLVGARASGNTACFEHCMDWLRGQAERDGTSTWPFMLAMREIGLGDLSRGVREMVEITQRRIGPQFSKLDALHRMGLAARSATQDAIGVLNETAEVTRALDHTMAQWLRASFGVAFDDKIAEVIESAQYATIGLCIGRNPIEVCNAFLPYLETDRTLAVGAADPVIACIVAMIFFANATDAVFSVIGSDVEAFDDGGGEVDGVALGLTADPQGGIGGFARFLVCTFDALSVLPRSICQSIRDHILACLSGWCREAVRTAKTTPPAKELLCRLRSTRSDLGTAITTLLKFDEAFRKPGSPLQALAVDVLTDCTDWDNVDTPHGQRSDQPLLPTIK